MTALPRLGVRVPNLVSPAPAKVDAFDKVAPKLDSKKSSFILKQSPNLVPVAQAASDYDQAFAYSLVDFNSGQVLESKSADKRLPIASITKLMTAVVALDLASPEEKLTVSEKAAHEEPTRLALTPGDQLTVTEAIKGALLSSANDCAQVLEEGIDQKYGEEIFIRAMNEKAKDLGLKNTYFTNPQGFDDGSPYSSANDMAKLAQYALTSYPLIANIVAQDHSELLPTSTHRKYEYLNNWNGLLGVYPGVEGVKIGNTDAAGYTTLVVSERGGHKLIAVLLGAPGVIERDQWTAELLDEGFAQFGLPKVQVGEDDLKAKYATWKYFQ